MPTRQSSGLLLRPGDYLYLLLCCVAAVWEAWCFDSGRSALLVIPMGFPFGLASYAHATFLSNTSEKAERPVWPRMLVLWVGMPLSLSVGALTMLALSGIMHIAGFGISDTPGVIFRLLVGEGAACLAWAKCLLIWSRHQSPRRSGNRLLILFVTLYAGIFLAHGLSLLIREHFSKDVYLVSVSIIETAISAMIVIFMGQQRVGGPVTPTTVSIA